HGTTRGDLLARGELFVFGTTRATNAVVTGSTARTALLVTRGHPDILLLREGGGRTTLFDYTQEYPDPYVPRALTFEVTERIGADGSVVVPLDEQAVLELLPRLERSGVEAVAVSLLWSVVSPVHEERVGELLREHAPHLPFTLGHRLNPAIREYRRTSSAAIDASLKPLMSTFFEGLDRRLRKAGFGGRLLIVTSAGGVLDAGEVAATPIHSIGSGPAAAPVAGRHFADIDLGARTAIVTDAGGTTYDVSLIRQGRIPWTRETVVGHPVYGYMTGFPSVDVRSIGAGGGSIAWVDGGGMLHVGPESAGADPGPACYGRGGSRATVTDACVVLGWLDPAYFLGGEMPLDAALAHDAVRRDVADPLGLGPSEAAAAVLDLAVERMVQAIEEITLNQGIDPREAVTIGGGGGAGLYAVAIARRLRCPRVIVPQVSAALSATGALLSDLQRDFVLTDVMGTGAFDVARANATLGRLAAQARAFLEGPGAGAEASSVTFSVEARYPHQVWEIEVPLPTERFDDSEDVERLRQAFHRQHEQVFAVRDAGSAVEVVAWRAHVRCRLRSVALGMGEDAEPAVDESTRPAYFPGHGERETAVVALASLEPGRRRQGPLLIESPTTTVVLDPGAAAERLPSGSLLVWPVLAEAPTAGNETRAARA
ncbi:MAG TPA: hydantoinase/oxoprolinase family protein, partial [Gaiellaceae bacterium]|nr:hydantoinase/oxoprolinase family protein [Gaiellaceae bacterium]